jgi:hypothetical protein
MLTGRGLPHCVMLTQNCSAEVLEMAARPEEIKVRRLARKSLQLPLAVLVDILCVVWNCRGGENASLYLRDDGMR